MFNLINAEIPPADNILWYESKVCLIKIILAKLFVIFDKRTRTGFMEPTGLGHDKVHFVRDHFDGRLRVVQINRLNILPSLNFLNLFFVQKSLLLRCENLSGKIHFDRAYKRVVVFLYNFKTFFVSGNWDSQGVRVNYRLICFDAKNMPCVLKVNLFTRKGHGDSWSNSYLKFPADAITQLREGACVSEKKARINDVPDKDSQ